MRVNWLNLWTGGSAVLLIGSQTVAAAALGGWAVAGLLGLSTGMEGGFEIVACLAALALTYKFARQVHRVEPFFRAPEAGSALVGSDVR